MRVGRSLSLPYARNARTGSGSRASAGFRSGVGIFGLIDAADEGWQHMLAGGVMGAVTWPVKIDGDYFDVIKECLQRRPSVGVMKSALA